MTPPQNEFAVRREVLARQIARQRGELIHAFRDLETPITYTEKGLTAFAFIRKNPWIFVAVPTALNIVFQIFGLRRKPSKPVPGAVQAIPNPTEHSQSLLMRWGGRALQAYQLYRRVRPYF